MSNLNLKGLWIPIEILTDTNLNDKEKHIHSIIMFLNKEHHRQLLYIKIIKVEIFEKYLLLLLSQTTRFWGTRLQSWIAMSGQVLIFAWKFETEQGFIKSRKNYNLNRKEFKLMNITDLENKIINSISVPWINESFPIQECLVQEPGPCNRR